MGLGARPLALPRFQHHGVSPPHGCRTRPNPRARDPPRAAPRVRAPRRRRHFSARSQHVTPFAAADKDDARATLIPRPATVAQHPPPNARLTLPQKPRRTPPVADAVSLPQKRAPRLPHARTRRGSPRRLEATPASPAGRLAADGARARRDLPPPPPPRWVFFRANPRLRPPRRAMDKARDVYRLCPRPRAPRASSASASEDFRSLGVT